MFEPDEARRHVLAALATYPDDPSGLTDEEAAAGFAQLQRLSESVEAKRLRWLADQDRRASYRRDGYISASAWLSDRFGVAAGAAKQQLRVAQALEEMPHVKESYFQGAISSGAVRVLVEARREHPDDFCVGESALVEVAATRPVEELRRVVGDWSKSMDDQRGLDQAEVLRERRRLNVCPTPTGMVRVEGELDPEGGEAVLTAFQAIVDAELRGSGWGDLRTPPQRRADALHELARRYLDSPERPSVAGERPHITVTVDAETLREGRRISHSSETNRCELDHAGAVHVATARRLACDASVMRVVMAGPAEPLEVGRKTPVVSAGLRRAVVLRDQGCRFPGCTRPHAWCDAHHVVHWANGGETDLRNLVLLCRPHHRLVHEGGFRLELADGKPEFRRPDGTALEDRRAPPQPHRWRWSAGGVLDSERYRFASASPNATSRVSMARAASSSVITSGGARRRTFPYKPPLPISRPASLQLSMTWAAASGLGSFDSESFTSSIPIIRPFPRTSPTTLYRSSRSFSPRYSEFPILYARSWSRCSSMFSMLARA